MKQRMDAQTTAQTCCHGVGMSCTWPTDTNRLEQ